MGQFSMEINRPEIDSAKGTRRWKSKKRTEMNIKEKAECFAKLHVKGQPLILYNPWDAGSAKAISRQGLGHRNQQLGGGSRAWL